MTVTWVLMAGGAAVAIILLWGRSRGGFSGDAVHIAGAAPPEAKAPTHATGMTRVLLIIAGVAILFAEALAPEVIAGLFI